MSTSKYWQEWSLNRREKGNIIAAVGTKKDCTDEEQCGGRK